MEVSPASGALVQSVARRVAQGGVALIADYGHEGSKTDTLRGFRGHKVWDPLEVSYGIEGINIQNIEFICSFLYIHRIS